eukprot:TRINITY_DN29623_c0_g1_i1.p1 TRINITY_DN29623_c0_g1~~TRINITY_DN29623_c0_g1_i1.p1  ORF type:complete len:769 (-),score=103.14 TRINITY_DN29623_c0_g1_i1:139-2445(-)
MSFRETTGLLEILQRSSEINVTEEVAELQKSLNTDMDNADAAARKAVDNELNANLNTFAAEVRLKMMNLSQTLINSHEEKVRELHYENWQLRGKLDEAMRSKFEVFSLDSSLQVSGKSLENQHVKPETEQSDVITLDVHEEGEGDVADEMCSAPTTRWGRLVNDARHCPALQQVRKIKTEAHFDLIPQWTVLHAESIAKDKSTFQLSPRRGSTVFSHQDEAGSPVYHGDILTEPAHCFQPYMLHPHSPWKVSWGVLSMIVIIWDVVTIPLQVFHVTPDDPALETVQYILIIFWSFDMFLQFLVGVDKVGVLDMRPGGVITHYLRTWFGPDACIILMDIVLLFVDVSTPGTGSLRIVRSAKILRLARMLRIRKLAETFEMMLAMVRMQHMILFGRILQNVFVYLFVNHYIACGWCSLGITGRTAGGANWIDRSEAADESRFMLYVSSLHWSLTQFSPATNNIAPVSGAERVFATCTAIFAFVAFSSFVSATTNAIQELRHFGASMRRQETILRRYFCSRQLTTGLWFSIQMYHRNKGFRQALKEDDVELLLTLPERLRTRLHRELYLAAFKAVPWMADAANHFDDHSIISICHHCMTEINYAPHDNVFLEGHPATFSYHCTSGESTYFSVALPDGQQDVPIEKGAWLSDLALWARWLHRGNLEAKYSCDFIGLRCDGFAEHAAVIGGSLYSYLKMVGLLMIAEAERKEDHGQHITDVNMVPEDIHHFSSRAQVYAGFIARLGGIRSSAVSSSSHKVSLAGGLLRSLTRD